MWKRTKSYKATVTATVAREHDSERHGLTLSPKHCFAACSSLVGKGGGYKLQAVGSWVRAPSSAKHCLARYGLIGGAASPVW